MPISEASIPRRTHGNSPSLRKILHVKKNRLFDPLGWFFMTSIEFVERNPQVTNLQLIKAGGQLRPDPGHPIHLREFAIYESIRPHHDQITTRPWDIHVD